MPATNATSTPARNQAPMADWVNEWTDSITPDRVRNVPSRVSTKVVTTRMAVHVRSDRPRSATIAEWMKAVAVSHGRRAAFSTGSQAQ